MALRRPRVKRAREADGHEIWRMRRQGLSALHAKRPPEAARAANELEALHPADGAARRLAARRAATPSQAKPAGIRIHVLVKRFRALGNRHGNRGRS